MEVKRPGKLHLTHKILLAMASGVLTGLLLNQFVHIEFVKNFFIAGVFDLGGQIFITLLRMLVVPIVFVSLVCGTCKLGNIKQFGKLAGKTIALYLLTTAVAITLALLVASFFHIGQDMQLTAQSTFSPQNIPSLKQTLLNIFPHNPIAAMASGNMLQIIIFAILLGLAIANTGSAGQRIASFFQDLDKVIMKLIAMIISITPYGVFCLIAVLFGKSGITLLGQLLGYFVTVLLVLLLQLTLVYPTLLYFFTRLNVLLFFRKLFSSMLFAFSTSSSNASIPIVLQTVEKRLGVRNTIASFVIPLGATINMDGTAIMQGVATVFIANLYAIPIGIVGYLTVILTATLASIGTAGVPSVGLITLTMVLQQVGLPIEGIALIIGIDRILDMSRTAVNITGDSAIACIVAKSENALQQEVYLNPDYD